MVDGERNLHTPGRSSREGLRALRKLAQWALRQMRAMTGRGLKAKPAYEMRARRSKLIDVGLCLIIRAEESGVAPTRFQLADALFLADVAHIALYRRPVSFDHYDATAEGPRAEAFDAMLMGKSRILRELADLPWTTGGSRTSPTFHSPTRPVDDHRALTQSDVIELRSAMERVLQSHDTRPGALTKVHPAYLQAWVDGCVAVPMNLLLLLPEPNEEEARRISWISSVRD